MITDPIETYKISRFFHRNRLNSLGKLIDLFARWWFGCYCPGSADIGDGTKLGYGGLGVVIHKDAVIGVNTNIGTGVVIGGDGNRVGVPTIGHGVTIGAGAKIIGPIVVGDGARIGANAVVIDDVPAKCTAVGVPARIVFRD